jgi:hypothetical protein
MKKPVPPFVVWTFIESLAPSFVKNLNGSPSTILRVEGGINGLRSDLRVSNFLVKSSKIFG